MPHEITTDDLITIRTIDEKIDRLLKNDEEQKEEIAKLRNRMYRLERAHPGGAWGKIIERGILVALTTFLGWQATQGQLNAPPQPAPTKASASDGAGP